jgi:uncharacterized beta-barrel protein YwiB (DUF1934 family)
MVRIGDAWVLMYLEQASRAWEARSTTLRVADDGTVALVRQGETTMQMQFSQGRQHLTSMSHRSGLINVGLSTHKVSSKLSPGGESWI